MSCVATVSPASLQIMHVGPNCEEVATFARMHHEFLPGHDLVGHGRHHGIYLTDPNRVAPEKPKTVLRQPVGHVVLGGTPGVRGGPRKT